MKTWERVANSTLCGGCDNQLRKGDPVLVYSLGTTKTLRKIRCVLCAGPAPSDLPPLVVRQARGASAGFVPLKTVAVAGLLPLDWKRASAGDREPGEEG